MMQKQLALTLVIAHLLGVLCACAVPETTPSGLNSTPAETSTTYKDALSGTNFDPTDIFTWFSDTPSYPTDEDIAKIQPGMTLWEVLRIIGRPQGSAGTSLLILEWERHTDINLQIVFEDPLTRYDENLTHAEAWVVKTVEPEEYYEMYTPPPPRKDPYYDPNDPMTWYSETPSHPTEEELSQIQIGMSMGSVFFYIGLPQRDVGSGKIILEWDLENGGHLQIPFVKNDAYAYAKYPLATQMVVERIEFLDCGYNPEDQSTWYSDTPVYPTAEDIAKIKPGMPVSLVFYAIGLPQRDAGPGMLLEWDLENGEHLQIAFVKNYANEKLPLATHMVVEKMEATDPDIIPTFPPPTYYEPIYDPSDPSTWYSSTPSFPTAEGMARIQPGMAMTEVFRIIGLPQVNASHYECIMDWKVRASGYLRITFVKKDAEAGLSATNMVVESLELVPTS